MKTLILAGLAMGVAAGCLAAPEPGTPAPANVQPVLSSYREGCELLKAGKKNEALAAFNRAIAAGSGMTEPDARALVASSADNAGGILVTQGKWLEAEASYRQALAANPRHAMAMNDLGVVYLKQGRTNEAIEQFRTVIKENPKLSLPYQNLAECLMAAGTLDAAAEVLSTALKAEPSDQRAAILLARVYELKGDRAKEEEVWKTLVKTMSGSPRAKLQLGQFYKRTGAGDKARPLYQEVLAASKGVGPAADEARQLMADLEKGPAGGEGPEYKRNDRYRQWSR